MIKCLNCEKEFEPKRETAKYCSVNCRVRYNQKNGKKNAVSKFQMQALYNEVLSMVRDLSKPTNEIKPFEQPKTNYSINTAPLNLTQPQAGKSFEQFKAEKQECESEESWEKLKQEILSSWLTKKQKDLLIKYS